ncbi:MAG: site-specific integrase [Anaerolineae bacterium]|jgi:site-specific recombinase XerD|nr:site-specific integrase [Anaerolineae bacterium]
MADQHLIGSFVRRFLLEDLVADRNLSPHTQKSYRDTIRLLFGFIADRHSTDPTRVAVEQVDAAVVRSFLVHLEDERGNSIVTRNQRLTALHSLFRFIGRLVPELVDHAAQIQAIPLRRTAVPAMPYLDKHEMDAMLEVPDRRRAQGRRDYALLLFLYNTGARATEAAQVTVADIDLGTSPSARFEGKGRKIRTCPLWSRTAEILRELLGARIDGPRASPVFLNVRGQPITRYGVHALVARAVDQAAESVPSIRDKRVSPHTIRHTTAVHLLRAGVDINTIRAWLGHVSLETTNRYAEVDLEMKAKALETCAITGPDPAPTPAPRWRTDIDLMSFLASL